MTGGGPCGDPTAAMLEVLDPSQNNSFVDHYLNLPFDLSSVPLHLHGEQPVRHPGPAARPDGSDPHRRATRSRRKSRSRGAICCRGCSRNTASPTRTCSSPTRSLGFISSRYSREAGLRNFERNLAAIMRKRARRKAEGEEGAWVIDVAKVEEILGVPRYPFEEAEKEPEVGAVTGLAWTATGGELMVIEALRMPGTRTLTVTGQLGDVMRESVDAAYSYVRSRARCWGSTTRSSRRPTCTSTSRPARSRRTDRVPGIAVTLAIASVLRRRAVRRDVAMTGEVTLRGKALEIGGVKEKVLAAYRAGLREVMLPESNEKDLRDVPDEVRANMVFTFVSHDGRRVPDRTPARRAACAIRADVGGARRSLRPRRRNWGSARRRRRSRRSDAVPSTRQPVGASLRRRDVTGPYNPVRLRSRRPKPRGHATIPGWSSRFRSPSGQSPAASPTPSPSGCCSARGSGGSASRARSPRISRGSPRASGAPSASGSSRRTTSWRRSRDRGSAMRSSGQLAVLLTDALDKEHGSLTTIIPRTCCPRSNRRSRISSRDSSTTCRFASGWSRASCSPTGRSRKSSKRWSARSDGPAAGCPRHRAAPRARAVPGHLVVDRAADPGAGRALPCPGDGRA